MSHLDELRAKAREIAGELVALRDLDELDEAQEERYEELLAIGDELADDIEAEEARERKLERVRAMLDDPGTPRDSGAAPFVTVKRESSPYDLSEIRVGLLGDNGRELRGKALKAVEIERDITDDDKHRLTGLLERDSGPLAKHLLVTGNPTYRFAWAKAVTGNAHMLDADERRAMEAVRAASLTNASGGFAVPFTLDPTVILTNDGVVNPVRSVARTITITTDQWNGVTSAGVTASWDGEAAQVSDDAPTLTQPSIDVEKAQAFVPASIEITQDWAGMADEVARLIADAKDRLEGTAFTTGAGSGSNEPDGVVAQVAAVTASRVAATTNNTFGLVDVYATLEGLPPRHRSRARWMASLQIINDIRQFATANNYHGFLTDLRGDTPAQLLGKPLHENSSMDTAIATGDDDVLIVGDFSKYYIIDRVGLSIEFIPHLFATANNRPSGQRGWYAYWRVGGGAVDTGAFRVLRV